MPPRFFRSIAYDRGTRWGRKHQTLSGLGRDLHLPSHVDLRDALEMEGIAVYDQVRPSFESFIYHIMIDLCRNRASSNHARRMRSVLHGSTRKPRSIQSFVHLDFSCTTMNASCKAIRTKIAVQVSALDASRSNCTAFAPRMCGLITQKWNLFNLMERHMMKHGIIKSTLLHKSPIAIYTT